MKNQFFAEFFFLFFQHSILVLKIIIKKIKILGLKILQSFNCFILILNDQNQFIKNYYTLKKNKNFFTN